MSCVRYNSEFAIQHLPPGKDQSIDWNKIEDEEFYNKRIALKILKHRANPRANFVPEKFKNSAVRDMSRSGDVKAFRESGSRIMSKSSNRSRQEGKVLSGGSNRDKANMRPMS